MKICPNCNRSDHDAQRFCKHCNTELFFPERITGSGGTLEIDREKSGGKSMLHKMKKIGKYIVVTILANVLFGIVLYFGFTFLDKYSPLLAYLWNFVVIVIVLLVDDLTLKSLESGSLLEKLKKEKDPEKIFQSIERSLNNLGSFKADLYLFYIIILVFSPIIDLYPALVGESLGNFISANSYSILLLIAFDTLIKQYGKDRKNMKRILVSLKEAIAKQD